MTRTRLYGAAMIGVVGVLGAGAVGARAEGSLNPMALLDKAALADFVQRPLFDPTRRLPPEIPPPPVVEEPPVVAVAAEAPPALRLLGVIYGPRDLAIVRRQDAHTVILRSGDQVDGWTVTVRPSNSLSLKKGVRSNDYALFNSPALGVENLDVAARDSGVEKTRLSEVHATDTKGRPLK